MRWAPVDWTGTVNLKVRFKMSERLPDHQFVRVDKHLMNLSAVADAHWEDDELFVHFAGGGFAKLSGPSAKMIWEVLETLSMDLVEPAA